MLDKLFIKNDTWLRMAFGICKDSELAKDLVQEMYIKFSDCNKEINDYYVFYAIKHIFINQLRENEKVEKAEKDYFYLHFERYEEDKEELEVPDVLSWVEKQILIHRQDKSCRDIEKEFDIHFLKVHRIENKAKQKIKIWEDQRKLKD